MGCGGCTIETIEGLSRAGRLHPIQQASIDQDGYQCGFCTPGQVLTVKALLERNPDPAAKEVKRAVSGNLCRCGAYPKIVQAAMAAAKSRLREESRIMARVIKTEFEFEGRFYEKHVVVEGDDVPPWNRGRKPLPECPLLVLPAS